MSEAAYDDSWDPDEPWVVVVPAEGGDRTADGGESFRIELPEGIGPFVVERLRAGARAFDDTLALSVDEGDGELRELDSREVARLIDDASATCHDALGATIPDDEMLVVTQAATVLATIWSMRLQEDDFSGDLPQSEYVWVAAIGKIATDCEQMLFARIRPRPDGTFSLRWRSGDRAVITSVMDDMAALLSSDDPSISRLFPSAYGSDDERNAGWDALMRGELIERRLAALATVDELLRRDRCTADELNAFMRSINDARLVLGTRLDVDEEGRPDNLAADQREAYLAYEHLGFLLSLTIRALRGSL